jgi:hypothetical protein
MHILVVTGTRSSTIDYGLVNGLVNDLIAKAVLEFPAGSKPIIWHGDCPTGVDAIAKAWGNLTFGEVPFPADWSQGAKAGPLRNECMIREASIRRDDGADVRVLAIGLRNGQMTGTVDCINRALKYRLPMRVWFV